MTYLLIFLMTLNAGKASYQAGEFKQAVTRFQVAQRAEPQCADSYYWLGRSYESLADISTPFGRKYRGLARVHLTKAVELAPKCSEYRRELFDFLLDSGNLAEARAMLLLKSAESDPEYDSLLARFDETKRLNDSLRGRLTKGFQLATAWR